MNTELIRARHSVRQYKATPIEQEIRDQLNEYVRSINEESGLHLQVLYDEPECFSSRIAHYGKFENANNYIAVVGKTPRIWMKKPDITERKLC